MRCHVCNAEVGDGQRFCHECGESLTGVTDATQELSVVPADELAATQAMDAIDSDAESTEPEPVDESVPDPAATQPIDEIPPDAVAPDAGLLDTQQVPASELPSPPVDAAAVAAVDPAGARPIGASLFDPETAPPVAEPEWSEPIPSLRDDMFGTDHSDPEPVTPPPASESTTTVPVQPYDAAASGDLTTGTQPIVYDVDGDRPAGPLLDGEIQPFKLRPAFVFGFLSVPTMILASLADITDIRTSRVVAGIDNRLTSLDVIGSNLVVAGLIGTALMLIGGLLQCFHLRWGAGLAGGAGLAVVGWAGLVLGLAEVPIDSAERITRDPSTPGPFTLTVTRDLGYWLIVALAALGLIVFLLSLTSAGTGGRRGLDPWTAALGAVAALVIAAGPLITVGGANFDVNFGTAELPAAFFAGRLVQLGLIALTGVLGFLLVRPYGLGLAAGGVSIAIWLWVSSLVPIGDKPLGIAAGNLGSVATKPHAVTTVGVALTILMLVASAMIAGFQRPRS